MNTSSWAQENPLADLTVVSTQLKCRSGFADISYGYKRGTSDVANLKLEFVVIQTSKRNPRFRRAFQLSSKVDDVTSPAYLDMSDGVIDLPDRKQIHAIIDWRHYQADSDVTLAEIRSWLDQTELRMTIDALLEHKTKLRAGKQDNW
ncbi:MAG: hypothetical protein AAGJ40_24535 [Planctomycetota bacterium]